MMRNPYLREHPLAFCFAVGAALVGIVYGVQITTGAEVNPILATQPEWVQITWAAFYFVGGMLSAWGIPFGRPKLESAGFTLLAATLAIAVVIQVSANVNYASLVSGGSLTVGCALRALLLSLSSARLAQRDGHAS